MSTQVKERVHSKDKQELKQEIGSSDLNSSAKKADSHERLNNSVTGSVDRKASEHGSPGDLKVSDEMCMLYSR
jgi:hypothetical protein